MNKNGQSEQCHVSGQDDALIHKQFFILTCKTRRLLLFKKVCKYNILGVPFYELLNIKIKYKSFCFFIAKSQYIFK